MSHEMEAGRGLEAKSSLDACCRIFEGGTPILQASRPLDCSGKAGSGTKASERLVPPRRAQVLKSRRGRCKSRPSFPGSPSQVFVHSSRLTRRSAARYSSASCRGACTRTTIHLAAKAALHTAISALEPGRQRRCSRGELCCWLREHHQLLHFGDHRDFSARALLRSSRRRRVGRGASARRAVQCGGLSAASQKPADVVAAVAPQWRLQHSQAAGGSSAPRYRSRRQSAQNRRCGRALIRDDLLCKRRWHRETGSVVASAAPRGLLGSMVGADSRARHAWRPAWRSTHSRPFRCRLGRYAALEFASAKAEPNWTKMLDARYWDMPARLKSILSGFALL
jgi:hypothetical protein